MEQQVSDKPVQLTWEVNPRDPEGVTGLHHRSGDDGLGAKVVIDMIKSNGRFILKKK